MSSSLPQTATNSQSLNGIISLSDGVVTIEDGVISGLTELELTDLQVSDTATIENLVVNNQIDMTSGRILNLAEPTLAQDASTKNYTDTASVNTNYLKRDGSLAMLGAIDMNTSNKISNLAEPTLAQDASTKYYTDNASVNTNYLKRDGSLAMLGAIDMNTTNKIINLADPVSAQDASTKYYTDNASVNTNYLKRDGSLAMLGAIDMNTSNKITNLADPVSAQDASTKYYTDNASVNTNYLKRDGSLAMTGALNMGTTHKITNLANGSNANDAVNKSQLDLKSDTSYVDTNFLNKTTATAQIVNSNLDMNTKRIYNLSNPLTQTDAVNLSYLSTNYFNKTATANQTIANKVSFTNTTTDIVSNPVITMFNTIGGNSNGNFLRFQKGVVETSNTEIGGLSACDKNIGNTLIRVADLIFSRGSNGEARMDLEMIDGQKNPLRITDGEFTSKNNNYYILKQDGTNLLNYTSASDDWAMSKDLNMTQNNITNANTLSANFNLKVADATSGFGTPAIQFQNTTTGSNNGIYMRFYKNFNRLPDTELGGIIFADKNATSQAISRAVQLKASIGSDSTPIFDILFNSDGFNPLKVSNTQNILSNDDFYIKNKTSAQDLFTYLNSTDKFTMYKPLQIETTNHIAFYNSDLTTESGMKMYFDRSQGSLGRFYMDMRGSEIQIRTDSGSTPTSERVKINNNETQINNNLKCNGSVTLGNNINNDTTTFNSVATFNADVLVDSNKHLMLGGNPASTQGMRLVYDAGFQANGTAYIDSRATSLIFRLNTTTEPTSTRVVIGANQTLINSGFAVNGNTIIGNDPTSDTCLFNCQATFPDDSKLTFVAGSNLEFNLLSFATFNTGSGLNINDSAINFNEGAVVNGSRVNLRSVSGNLTMSNSNTEGGILCTNTSTISITLPPKDAYWNNRSFYLKTQTGNVNIVMNTGTSIDNDFGTLQITTDYRGYLFGFDNDYVNNGKIWKLVAI
jgi:uncharacterized protein YunC (DUF1805 family)